MDGDGNTQGCTARSFVIRSRDGYWAPTIFGGSEQGGGRGGAAGGDLRGATRTPPPAPGGYPHNRNDYVKISGVLVA